MSYFFKLYSVFALLLVMSRFESYGHTSSPHFDKEKLYSVLARNDMDAINALLTELQSSAIPEKNAYEGALLMKKAGLAGKAKEKLNLFKSGRAKLEAAIKTEEANVEYHFLRLIIQEHAPKVVKYKSDLKNDAQLIRNSFKKLSPVVQQAIKDYSKNSIILKPSDL